MNSIGQLNQLCSLCLSSLDFVQKTFAQQKLAAFLNTLSPGNLNELLNSVQESSIFVITSILASRVSQLKGPSEWLMRSIEVYSGWLGQDHTLVKNGKPLSYHLVGKCKQWIGQLFKKVYYQIVSEKQSKEKLKKYVSGLSQQLRVFSYIAFLESMNLIDYEIGFISFRNLMFSFQKDWIPAMFGEAHSILKRLSDTDELRPLISKMEAYLSLEDDSNQSTQEFSDLEFKLTQKVTELLQNLTEFHYNIDCVQYDKAQDFDDSPIQYPVEINHIITKEGLYQIAHAVMKRLVLHFPEHSITESFLRCFMKLSSPSSNDISFKKMAIETCMFIMSQKTSPNILYLLLNFNLRLMRNITFSTFFLEHQQFSVKWIHLLMELTDWVFEHTNPTYKNFHIDSVSKIFNIIFQASARKDLRDHKASLKTVAETLFVKLCSLLFSGNKSLIAENVMNFNQMKTKNEEQFKNWIPTIFLSSYKSFQTLRTIQISLYSNPQNTSNILNFNLLVGFLMSQYAQCFDENAHYDVVTTETKQIFGEIIKSSLEFQSPGDQFQLVPYQGSILYLYSSFIYSVINSIEYGGQTSSKFISTFVPQLKSTSLQSIVIQCMRQIGNRLSIPSCDTIKYSFYILYENTQSLHKHYQESFASSTLYKELLIFYINMASNSLKAEETIKCRKYLFQNLTALALCSNQYCITQVINSLLSVISSTTYQSDVVQLYAQIYDIRGICLELKDQNQLGDFVDIVAPMLDKLNRMVFVSPLDFGVARQTLKIYNTIFRNETSRHVRRNGELILSRVYETILPYWALILNVFNQPEEKLLQKNLEIALQIIAGFTTLFKDQTCNPHNTRDFAGLLSAILTACIKSSHILEKVFSDSMVVVRMFDIISNTDMVQCVCQLLSKDQLLLFFKYHIFLFRLLIQQLQAFIQRQKEQTLKEMEPVNIITAGMEKFYTFLKNRCLTIPYNLKSSKPNLVESSLRNFLGFDANIMNQIILQFFKICCLTCNKPEYSMVFSCSSGHLKNLVIAYPGSKTYVGSQLKKQFCNKQMQQKLDVLYQGCRFIRNVGQQFQEETTDSPIEQEDMCSEHFESLVKEWMGALDKTESILDDY